MRILLLSLIEHNLRDSLQKYNTGISSKYKTIRCNPEIVYYIIASFDHSRVTNCVPQINSRCFAVSNNVNEQSFMTKAFMAFLVNVLNVFICKITPVYALCVIVDALTFQSRVSY